MNHVITIPQKIAQSGDLVLVPRKEYEAMRRSLREHPAHAAGSELDADIKKSLTEYRAGKYFGPFDTTKEAVTFLRSHKQQARKK